jgi:phenylacetic acid degradation operon negative regulatory protein
MSEIRNAGVLEPEPLSARSLILSLLLRTQPPTMRGSRLVQWCGLFGVAEGTARVALSRMVERGELRSADGTYELAGRAGRRRAEQDWSIEPKRERWSGAWRMAVVKTTSRAPLDRREFRNAMGHLRMGELREGAWSRPDNLPRAAAPKDAWDIARKQCAWWTATPDDDPVALARRLFDLAGSAKKCTRTADVLERATARAGDDPQRLAEAFAAGATALQLIRVDPLLPTELMPDGDPGDELRAAYRAWEREFADALQAWFRSHP